MQELERRENFIVSFIQLFDIMKYREKPRKVVTFHQTKLIRRKQLGDIWSY